VPRGRQLPLPSEVPVTCVSTPVRPTWFPPEAHISTGRLCSAGSGCRPVPRRQRSYAALRLPRPHRPPLRSSLANGLPRSGCLFFAPRHAHPPACRTSQTGHRRCVSPGSLRGETTASQVPGSSSSSVPWSFLPAAEEPGTNKAMQTGKAGIVTRSVGELESSDSYPQKSPGEQQVPESSKRLVISGENRGRRRMPNNRRGRVPQAAAPIESR